MNESLPEMNLTGHKVLPTPRDWSDAERERIRRECVALMGLGLREEAHAVIDALPLDHPRLERFRVLKVYLDAWSPRAGRTAEEGLALIESLGPVRLLVSSTAQALLTAHRGAESWRLLRQHPEVMAKEDPYNLACHACGEGDLEAAAGWLREAIRQKNRNLPRALLDNDLAPLWDMAAHGRMGETLAEAMASPEMEWLWDNARHLEGLCGIDYQMLWRVPAECRRFLNQEGWSQLLVISPRAPARIRWRHARWQDRLRARHAALLAAGIRRARTGLRSGQMRWAQEKAREGNYLGARWHMAWAVADNPHLFPGFLSMLNHIPAMAPVLKDFEELYRIDPGLLKNMARAMFKGSPLEKDLLDDAEHRAPANGLTLALAGKYHTLECEYLRAADAFLALARRWPDDPLGWVNTMDLCIRRNAWKGAEICAGKAPPSARLFHAFAHQEEKLRRREPDLECAYRTRPFCGQRDLGGIMIDNATPESKTKEDNDSP